MAMDDVYELVFQEDFFLGTFWLRFGTFFIDFSILLINKIKNNNNPISNPNPNPNPNLNPNPKLNFALQNFFFARFTIFWHPGVSSLVPFFSMKNYCIF